MEIVSTHHLATTAPADPDPDPGNMEVAVVDRDAITARNATESPLLRLPAELRQPIYKFAIGGHVLNLRLGPPWNIVNPSMKAWRLSSISPSRPGLGINPTSSVLIPGLVPGVRRQLQSECVEYPLNLNLNYFANEIAMNLFTAQLSATHLGNNQEIALPMRSLTNRIGDAPYEDQIESLARLPNLKSIFVLLDSRIPGEAKRILNRTTQWFDCMDKKLIDGVDLIILHSWDEAVQTQTKKLWD